MKSAYHAKSQRYASRIHYTVSPIRDIKEWKAEQAVKEAEWQLKKAERWQEVRNKAVKMVEDQMSTVYFTPEERAEINLKARSAGLRYIAESYGVLPQRPTRWQRVKMWFNGLWTS